MAVGCGHGLEKAQKDYIDAIATLDEQSRPDIVAADNMAGAHAEPNGVHYVASNGLKPIAGGVVRNSCKPDGCADFLGQVGAQITGPVTAGGAAKVAGLRPNPHRIRGRSATGGMAHYIDELTADSLTEDPLAQAHDEYLLQCADEVLTYGLEYFASRNLEVEFACRDVVADRDDSDLFVTPAGAGLVEQCDRFGAELVVAIRRLA